jgi:alpha-tubulin suppressor-like RCC1 family protein
VLGRRRRGVTAMLGALVLALAITAPAGAHAPYLARDWGLDVSGQLGGGKETGPNECFFTHVSDGLASCSATPMSPWEGAPPAGVESIGGGEHHSVMALSDGTVWSWGANDSGQLGDGSAGVAEPPETATPTRVWGLWEGVYGSASAVASGANHSLALLHDGTVVAWGANDSGQLGDGQVGAQHDSSTAVRVTKTLDKGALGGIAAIIAGEEHSLALDREGHIYAWGSNESGQLGFNTTVSREIRASQVPVFKAAKAIAAGSEHSLALEFGTVYAWGANSYGQLGDGTTTGPQTCASGPCSRYAISVSGLPNVTAIAAGGDYSLALLSDGTVRAWGDNEAGQLGNGTTTNSDVPVAVSGLSNVVAIAAGEEHSLALLANGTVMAWGANGQGQLGVGTTTGPEACDASTGIEACSRTPLQVGGLSDLNVKSIAAGGWHSLALGPPYPAVTAVSPKEGIPAGGTAVTVTGTELGGATAVKFGSVSATAFKVESSSSITALSPKGEGTVDVTVTTPEGTSSVGPADRYSYVNPVVPPPSVSSVSPSEGPAAGGTAVTISGNNLTAATAVKFGSSNATFTVNPQGTSIAATSPPGLGTVDVTVTTLGGSSATSSGDHFNYRTSQPTVIGVNPNSGSAHGPQTVEITGTNFFRPSAVEFGGTPARSFTAVSEGLILAITPEYTLTYKGPNFFGLPEPESVHVTVTTPAGTSATSPADEFTFTWP